MAQKFIGMRGIDPALFDEVVRIVKEKHAGHRRSKYSFVAQEINELLRLYVRSQGEIIARTHTDPKEKIISELEDTIEKRGLGKDNRNVEEILDKNHIIDERARDQYRGYANRAFDRMSTTDIWQGKRPKNTEVKGYN